MAVLKGEGALLAPDGRRVGGGPCAVVQRRRADGEPIVHGTCILQRFAEIPTPLDLEAEHDLVLEGGRSVRVRIVKLTMTSCGPEIVRFEGPGRL